MAYPYLSTLQEKQAQLAIFQEAFDRLILGETEVRIKQPNGGETEYEASDKPRIEKRIRELQSEIAALTGTSVAHRRRAIGVFTG